MLENKLGVFDSGLGGLTVLKDLLEELPNYNYVYLGDNARLPYGEKSPETIYNYTSEAVDFLFSTGCNLVVLACNTASSQALRRLQQEYLPGAYPNRRILGVIRPLAEYAANHKNLNSWGVIGTKATINSQAYRHEILKLQPGATIEEVSTPLLVPLIEAGWAGKPETKMILKKYLRPLKVRGVDSLILGCTHYPFLYREIQKIMGRKTNVLNSGKIIANSLKDYLLRHAELKLEPVAQPIYRYYTTDDPRLFKELGEKFLGKKIDNLERVKITEL